MILPKPSPMDWEQFPRLIKAKKGYLLFGLEWPSDSNCKPDCKTPSRWTYSVMGMSTIKIKWWKFRYLQSVTCSWEAHPSLSSNIPKSEFRRNHRNPASQQSCDPAARLVAEWWNEPIVASCSAGQRSIAGGAASPGTKPARANIDSHPL